MHAGPSDHRDRGTSPCWYCRDWQGLSGPHGLCGLPGAARVVALPVDGCAFYRREPGIDDDLWTPRALLPRGSPPGARSPG